MQRLMNSLLALDVAFLFSGHNAFGSYDIIYPG
jgi:hypothetical protein